MPLLPQAPPIAIMSRHGFDYMTVDARRRRVYAALTSDSALLVIDADAGKVLREIHVGTVHGVAVDPVNGHVFTGDGIDQNVSEVDPESGKVVRTTHLPGDVDAVIYDSRLRRIYADEDDGTRIFVLDAASMQHVGTVLLPGHKPEYLATDPATDEIYQNISDLGEYVVIDPKTLAIQRTVITPGIEGNHPLQFDNVIGRVLSGGSGKIAEFTADGHEAASAVTQPRVDQCDLGERTQHLVCAGGGELTIFDVSSNKRIRMIDQRFVAKGLHTAAIDDATDTVWTVWSNDSGEFAQAFRITK